MTRSFLEQEGGGLDGTRQRQHVDAGGARPLQGPLAGLGGRSPVVITSSITTIRFPLTVAACALSTLNAPATLRRRWSALSPTWLAVRFTRFSGEPPERLREHGRLGEPPPPQPR